MSIRNYTYYVAGVFCRTDNVSAIGSEIETCILIPLEIREYEGAQAKIVVYYPRNELNSCEFRVLE